MKKTILLMIVFNGFFSYSQTIDNLFTIVSTIGTNSSIRLGSLNPTSGFVNNIGTVTSPNSFGISGGALNQITNKFTLVGSDYTMSFNLSDGSIANELPINSFYQGTTYFSNVNFNYSNNTLYGLATTFDNNNNFQGMYLSKLNTETGNLTAISENSIALNYHFAGTAIDPSLMVYYFITESMFRGIDLYNGQIYSNAPIVYSNPNDFNFTNFTYNCADDTIYGLVTEDTQVLNPNMPYPVNTYIMRLGKINPATGEVTYVSSTPLPSSYYSVNASSTIDPSNGVFYFSNGIYLYGISLETGLLVSTSLLTYENGSQINFITNYNKCFNPDVTRMDPALSNADNQLNKKIKVYPNPTDDNLIIDSETIIDKVEVVDINGRTVKVATSNTSKLNVEDLQNGMYFLKITSNEFTETIKFIKK